VNFGGTLFVVWTGVAAASLTLAAVHVIVWALDRRRVANLAFCVVAVSAAAMAGIEFAMASAGTAEEYAQWLRWFHLAGLFSFAGLVLFVRLYFRAGRLWLGWTVR
jgi:hypothetical protein